MALPTAVNSQTTDSVTQVNTTVVGESPGVATANLDIATSQALANAAHNSALNQQQSFTIMQTSTVQGIIGLFTAGAQARSNQ